MYSITSNLTAKTIYTRNFDQKYEIFLQIVRFVEKVSTKKTESLWKTTVIRLNKKRNYMCSTFKWIKFRVTQKRVYKRCRLSLHQIAVNLNGY